MNNNNLTYVEWDSVNWTRAIQFWNENTNLDLQNSKTLEVGARHGGLSLWLASLGNNVHCTDLNGPSETAKKAHQESTYSDKISHGKLDITNIGSPEKYDIVVSKSVLGGVGASLGQEGIQLSIDEIHSSLRKSGEYWFAENLSASMLHQITRKAFVPWGNRWLYSSNSELIEKLSAFSNVQFLTLGFLATFGRSENQRVHLGNIDKIIDQKIPSSWNYIMTGVATK